MPTSDTSFGLRAEQIAQESAWRLRLRDAEQQRRTIVGTEDGHWLLKTLQSVRSKGATARLTQARRFHFLGDSAEAVLNSRSDESLYIAIDMPAGSIIRKMTGAGYSTWVFRVENGRNGAEYEHIDLAFRKVGHDPLLYLKSRQCGERTVSGRRAGSRVMGRGPDRSL